MNSRGRRKLSPSRPSRNKKKKGGDSFFEPTPKKRRKDDDVVESDDDSDYYESKGNVVGGGAGDANAEEEEEEEEETAAEKKYRIAREQIEKLRELTKKMEEDGEGNCDVDEEEDDEAIQGKRDSLIADILQKEHLQRSGRARRLLASRVLKPEASVGFQILQRHRQSVTAIALSDDDSRGFSASKDGSIIHWDVESGKKEKYLLPEKDLLSSHNAKNVKNGIKRPSKHVLTLAVSSDGRYLATGGLDRLVHLWDTRTREHIQAFHGHKGPVSCLTFRQGTSELFSGSFDRMIKWWNAEDRCHVNNLFGHQAEILAIDCLRKERILSVGRDRTLRLFKVLEESSLRYSTPSSALECCCFINNEEFLSGSDDGSIELWNILRRKPTYVVKNAHTMSVLHDQLHSTTTKNDGLSNGDIAGNACCKDEKHSSAQSWVSSVTVCSGSDLAASGAGNGSVCLWGVENDARSIRPLYDLPLVGFVNSLAFARSGRFLLAGVGQEPRLGRWGRIPATRNGVYLVPLNLSEEANEL